LTNYFDLLICLTDWLVRQIGVPELLRLLDLFDRFCRSNHLFDGSYIKHLLRLSSFQWSPASVGGVMLAGWLRWLAFAGLAARWLACLASWPGCLLEWLAGWLARLAGWPISWLLGRFGQRLVVMSHGSRARWRARRFSLCRP
jgi:hypothetical protein